MFSWRLDVYARNPLQRRLLPGAFAKLDAGPESATNLTSQWERWCPFVSVAVAVGIRSSKHVLCPPGKMSVESSIIVGSRARRSVRLLLLSGERRAQTTKTELWQRLCEANVRLPWRTI